MLEELFKVDRDFIRDENGDKVARSPADIQKNRQKKSKPIVDKFWKLLEDSGLELLPESLLDKAMKYALKYRKGLERFLEDGRLSLDNNLSERQIRHTVVGRKNWLFAGSHDAAYRMGEIYSLVATCKMIDVDPVGYIRWLLKRWSMDKSIPFDELLPENFKKSD